MRDVTLAEVDALVQSIQGGLRPFAQLGDILGRLEDVQAALRVEAEIKARVETLRVDTDRAQQALDALRDEARQMEQARTEAQERAVRDVAALDQELAEARRAHGEEMARLAETMLQARAELEEIHEGETARRAQEVADLTTKRDALAAELESLKAKFR